METNLMAQLNAVEHRIRVASDWATDPYRLGHLLEALGTARANRDFLLSASIPKPTWTACSFQRFRI